MSKIKDLKLKKRMFNDLAIDSAEVKEDDQRVVSFSFASRNPVLRDFGYEIIDTKNMDFSRLNNKAPLLFNHDLDNYIGVVENAYYNLSDDRCYCEARFDTSEEAEKIYQSVLNKVLTHVSFAYEIINVVYQGLIDGIEAYVCNVKGYEISIVTAGADDTVGISRSLENKEEDLVLKVEVEENEEKNEKKVDLDVDSKNEIKHNVIIKNDERGFKTMTEENKNVSEIIALGKRYKKEGMALNALERGITVNDFITELLEETSSKPSNAKKEDDSYISEGYNAGNALRSLMNGKLGGVEKETNDHLEKIYGKRSERSILVPFNSLSRSVTLGNSSSAGILKETNRSENFIDSLMNNLAIVQAGATYMNDIVGDLEIPKFNNIINAQYVGENVAATESDLDASMIKLSGKDLSANITISRKMKLQTSMNIQNVCFNQIYNALRAKMDIEALMGTGANGTVKGLLNLDGIGSITSGGKPTWQNVLDLEAQVKSKNALISKGCYISNSNVESLLKGTQKGSGLGFIHDGSKVNGYDLFTTNALKVSTTNEDVTTVTNPFIFGDFSQMFVGNWGVLEIMYDPYSLAKTGQEQLVAFVTFDVGVAHEESFSVIKDITVA